ncbi:MAG: ankyrin repeat domain-containing protein, partial [Planctomycetota bacterium]
MNRFAVLMSILLVAGLSHFDVTYGEEQPSRTLHDAAVAGDANEINALLSKGAQIDQKNRMGWTPLLTALNNNQFAVAELLIAKGADANAKDNRGETALALAVKAGQKALVEQLVAKGADVNAMAGPGETALSLAKKGGHTEIADFLVKQGGKEPNLQDMEGMYYGGAGQPYAGASSTVAPQGQTGAVDLLADPNEIRARVKTFPDLEKAVKETADKGATEMRQWEQKKYDNRTLVVRAVQKQFEEEMALARKIAGEEKAKKTTEAIDGVLSRRKQRSDAVYKELTLLKKEEKQAMSSRVARGPTRGRPTGGRNTTGYDTQGAQGGAYAGGAEGMPYGREETMRGRGGPQEQADKETQDELRLWSGANFEKKDELAKSVHQQILADVTLVRTVAVEEQAKKTTAALEGLLLARQERLDSYLKKMQEEEMKAMQQAQD